MLEVLHNICNMGSRDLPDMSALALGRPRALRALGLVRTYQANHSCPCYIYNMYIQCKWLDYNCDNIKTHGS